MAMTESTMMALGTQAPSFTLKNTEHGTTSLSDFDDAKALVVLFICNHCPYVIHIAPKLAQLAKQYSGKGVQFVAINSNDAKNFPADNFEHMIKEKHYAIILSLIYLMKRNQSLKRLMRHVRQIFLFLMISRNLLIEDNLMQPDRQEFRQVIIIQIAELQV
ncbi:redoxin family protein [Pseudocolwellia sp. HL-MZ19]|uniref:redoxin family protein n=1 Tax=unclassified Pseudocolwellia TaxID=2848178 RepID=UPI003CF9F6BE